jgi:predicted RNA binding protein YcfA (HicA-like mRNA interferase family)/predicted RNase H-like HicB family nuclease
MAIGYKVRDILQLLGENGWISLRGKGGYRQFAHSTRDGVVTLRYHSSSEDLHSGSVTSILRQAGSRRRRNEQMRRKVIAVPVVVLRTKTGYSAFSPSVDGCVTTAKTVDAALRQIKETLEFHLEGELLVKNRKKKKAQTVLKNSFADYGTDAVYASLLIPA